MIQQSNLFFNHGWGDEQLTPEIGVNILLKHIEHLKWKTIWCPFDKEDSNFVKILREYGHSVIHSHIASWQDFFGYEPEKWDVLISNPPYKNKRAFWERCLSFNKPFALLLPVNILSDSMICNTMIEDGRDLQLLIPNKRMKFFNVSTGTTDNKITFKACYFWVEIFKKQIILEEL